MMKYALLLLFGITCYSQNNLNRDITALSTQYISPNIDLPTAQINAVGGLKQVSSYLNVPIQTKFDLFTVGAGYNYIDKTGLSNVDLYVGRSGTGNDKLRMSLIFGFYRVNSNKTDLTVNDKLFLDRKASYAGASLSYHADNGTYFGITVRDVYDVAYTDGSDDVYYLYEAMTPSGFANVKLWGNNFETISLFGQYSYNAVEKSEYTASIEFKSESVEAGFFHSKTFGGFIQGNFGNIKLYGSVAKDVNIGAKLSFN